MATALRITTPTDREILITRSLDAPCPLVWDALTRPELIRRWLFCPPGWTMTACDEDVRAGGAYRWEWSGPDGQPAMRMTGVYREVVPPGRSGTSGRLVRTERFEFGCNAQAGEQLGAMVLEERAGTTTVSITVLYPSKEARDATIASGMEHGMAAGYDRMEQLLAEHLG